MLCRAWIVAEYPQVGDRFLSTSSGEATLGKALDIAICPTPSALLGRDYSLEQEVRSSRQFQARPDVPTASPHLGRVPQPVQWPTSFKDVHGDAELLRSVTRHDSTPTRRHTSCCLASLSTNHSSPRRPIGESIRRPATLVSRKR